MRVWKNKQRKRHLFFGYSFTDDKLLFSNEIATRTYKDIYYKASVLGTYLQSFNKWYNSNHNDKLPYLNLHGFRHTHASLLLSNGVDLKKVAERLGHKDITITANIYADVTPKARREVADKFSQIMGDKA